MNEGRFKALNKKVPALLLTAGMLFSTACSDKGESVSETQAADPATSESVAETEPVYEKPSYDPVPIDYESDYLKMVETGNISSYEASVEKIELFKDLDRIPEYCWKFYNDHIFIYAENLNKDEYCREFTLIPGVDTDPTIYEYDLDGNLISSLSLIDFWAKNFPSSNMNNRSSFISEKNLSASVLDGGFVIGCDNEYCMYSFKDATGRKIVTEHGLNPGAYYSRDDGYFDGEHYLTLTYDDQNWYLESFDINGNHDCVLVNSDGMDFGASCTWAKIGEDTVAVSYQEQYILHMMIVDFNDMTWSMEPGDIKDHVIQKPIDGYYEDAWTCSAVYDLNGNKIIDIEELKTIVDGHKDDYRYWPEYIGCDDEGLHFIALSGATAEYLTLNKTDKPDGKEVITMVIPNGFYAYIDGHSYIEAAVCEFNWTSDKYYCKLIQLNDIEFEDIALELKADFSSEYSPDIVISPSHYLLLDDADLCADMSEFVDENLDEGSMMSVIDGCREPKTDKLYCLPLFFYIEGLTEAPGYCDDSYESYLAMLKDTGYDPIWAAFDIRNSQLESGTEAYIRLLLEDQFDLYFEKGYFDADAKVFYDMADFMLLNNYQMVTNSEYDQNGPREVMEKYDFVDPDIPWIVKGSWGSVDLSVGDSVGLPSSDGRGAVVKPDCCINVSAGSAEKEGVIELLNCLYNYGAEQGMYSVPVNPKWPDPDDVIDKGLGELTIQPATDRIIIDIIIEETMKYLDDVDGTVKLEDVAKRINERVGGYLAAYEK